MRHTFKKYWTARSPQRQQDRHLSRPCNLCSQHFTCHTVFDRYCPNCKSNNELLRFYEWLPEVEYYESVEEAA